MSAEWVSILALVALFATSRGHRAPRTLDQHGAALREELASLDPGGQGQGAGAPS